jgi:hypothetical protein
VSKLDRLRQSVDRLESKLPPQPEPYERYRDPHDRDSEYDALGRKVPRKIGLDLALRRFPALVERMREVPARAIAEEGEDDEGAFALVECPCGQKPIARSKLTPCSGCERWYLKETSVLVLYGDMELPQKQPQAS